MGSRRFNFAFAFTVLALVAALAVTAGTAFDSVAHGKGGGSACKTGREQQGCKLPEGAVYNGSGPSGSVKFVVDSSETYLEVKLAPAQVTCDPGYTPSRISAYPVVKGAAPKVGATVKIVAKPVEAEGTAAGSVKISSATAARASLEVADEGGNCRGSIELNLKRQ